MHDDYYSLKISCNQFPTHMRVTTYFIRDDICVVVIYRYIYIYKCTNIFQVIAMKFAFY